MMSSSSMGSTTTTTTPSTRETTEKEVMSSSRISCSSSSTSCSSLFSSQNINYNNNNNIEGEDVKSHPEEQDDDNEEHGEEEEEDWEADVRKSVERQQEFSSKLEFGLKLGYTESQVESAIAKLGLDSDQNQLLAELICLADVDAAAAAAAVPAVPSPRGHSPHPPPLLVSSSHSRSLDLKRTSLKPHQPLHQYHSVPADPARHHLTPGAAILNHGPQPQQPLMQRLQPLTSSHHLPLHVSHSHQPSSSGRHAMHRLLNPSSHPQLHSYSSSPASLVSSQSVCCLRPIVVDGSNVAMTHGNRSVFSCLGIRIVVSWFQSRGHRDITVFVPMWRKEPSRPETPITHQKILQELEDERILVLTPSRTVAGRRVVCYDDRFVLNLALENDGIVVSNDNYRDLVSEKASYARIVEDRQLMYTFANDRLMVPEDPLGRNGPTLDSFLRFPVSACPVHSQQQQQQRVLHHHQQQPLHHHQHHLLSKSLSSSSSSSSSTTATSSSSSCGRPVGPVATSLSSLSSSSCSRQTTTDGGGCSVSPVSLIVCPYGKKCTYGNKCKYSHPERGSLVSSSVADRLLEQNRSRKQQSSTAVTAIRHHTSIRQTSSLPLSLTGVSGGAAPVSAATAGSSSSSLLLRSSHEIPDDDEDDEEFAKQRVVTTCAPASGVTARTHVPLTRTKSVVPGISFSSTPDSGSSSSSSAYPRF